MFNIDWMNKEQVVKLARKFHRPGLEQVVYKNPLRSNYNITHASRTDLYDQSWVVWPEKKE